MSAEEFKSRDRQIEDFIERLALGDMSAMGDLYSLIEADIFSFALSKVTNKHDASDITHDTFVQIYKNSPLYTPMGKPMAWIFTIELNLIRRQANLSRRSIALDENIEVETDDVDFQESVINNEFLRSLLKILTEDEREIIALHVVSGLKHREIAKLLDKPLSTVLSKYNRAIKKLQLEVRVGGYEQ